MSVFCILFTNFFILHSFQISAILTPFSDNAAVQRGIKAIDIIYNMTSRIPHLMKQSHLESNEGMCLFSLFSFPKMESLCR